MKILLTAALCALAAAFAAAGPAQAAPKLKNQKFAVKFTGDTGQAWKVRETDVEHEPNCTIGPGAYGQSEFVANTRGTETATFLANRKVGVAYGRVPVEGFIRRFFTIGSEPPEDCKDVYYEKLQEHQDCSEIAQWNQQHPWYGASVAIQVVRGKAAVDVSVDHYTENVDELTFPYCPFAGAEEVTIDGATKISTKKLFSGKPVTVRFKEYFEFPAPDSHDVEGAIEWQLTLKAKRG